MLGKQEKKWHFKQMKNIAKVDLHRHLDCSMRWETLLELAPIVGIELPADPEKVRDFFLVRSPMKNLAEVLQKFMHAQKVLANEVILERLAFEACEDAFNDGIRVLELRYAPTFIQQGHPSLNFESIHQAFLRGLERAEKTFPMATGLICIIQRTLPMSEAESVCDFAIENKSSFVGIDLADAEENFEPKKFEKLFSKAKGHGLNITIHSGEVPSPLAPQWVKDSIQILGAQRIGHGVQIIQNPEIIKFIVDQKIPLEVCPISNWLTQAFPSHEAHPITQLIKLGVQITINSDDPGIFGTKLSDDYHILQKYHHFQAMDFQLANDIAIKHSFISNSKIQKVWSKL